MIRRESAPVLGRMVVFLLLAFVPPALAAPAPTAKPTPAKAKAAPAKTPAAPAKPKPVAALPAADVPLDPIALQAQAHAAVARGDNDVAIVLAQSAIVANPALASSYDALGDVYAAQKQPEFARNFYLKALDIDPADTAATQAIAALDRADDNRKADASNGSTKSATP